MGYFKMQWFLCLSLAFQLTNTLSTPDANSSTTIASNDATTTKVTMMNSTRTTTGTTSMIDVNATSTGTETSPAIVRWASTINQIVLTEIVLYATTLTAGAVMVALGGKLPTLLAGNLVLAVFLGMLMKSGQEENVQLSQWVFWPVIVAVSAFLCLSVLIKCYRNIMVGVITGVVLAAAGLAVAVASTLPAFPWGVAVALLLYIIGHVAAAKSIECPVLYKMLSALIGGFLIAHGALFFVFGRDFAEEIAGAIVRATDSDQDRESLANDVRPKVIFWLGLSVALLIARYVTVHLWQKYKPQRFRKGEKAKGALTPRKSTEELEELEDEAV